MAAGCLQVYMVTAAMLLMEFMTAADRTINKAAMNRGMSSLIFLLYENILAAIFLLLCSIPFYRKRCLTPPTISIFCRICFLSIIRYLMHIFKSFGLRYTSPALAAAMYNLGPAFTFLLAIICRMEKLDLRIQSSRVKFLGLLVSIAGTITVTLYKGPPIIFSASSSSRSLNLQIGSPLSDWAIGCTFLLLGCFTHSLEQIIQTWIIMDYPEVLAVVVITCITSSVQSVIVCLFAERDPNAWRLRFDMELISIVYSAILMTGARSVVHLWSCKREGPVYTAMFKPVELVIAIAMGVCLLRDTLYLGSLLGAAVIILGFYSMLWGQAQQHLVVEPDRPTCSSDPSSHEAPLLEGKRGNVRFADPETKDKQRVAGLA